MSIFLNQNCSNFVFFIFCVKCLFKEIPNVPTLDVAFAISATATDAETNFKLMKDTITAFADMYGMSKINYAVVAYGEKPKNGLISKANHLILMLLSGQLMQSLERQG